MRRWPEWVYGSGAEPDVRFSFANERTFLAWIRTALALLAAGVALDTLDLSMAAQAQRGMAGLMVVLGTACAVAAWVRWARAERAMRRNEPLPGLGFSLVLGLGIVAAALVLVGSSL